MTFKASNPEAIEFTMEVKLTMKEWRELKAQSEGSESFTSWPSTYFRNAIREMVSSAEKHFYPDSKP